MKNRLLRTELLEPRTYLSVSAGVDPTTSNLVVTGDTLGPVEIRATGADAFAVTADGVTNAITGAAGSEVLLNLQSGAISIDLSGVARQVTLQDGTVAGPLTFRGSDRLTVARGAVVDQVMADLVGGENTVQIGGQVRRSLLVRGSNGNDTVEVDGGGKVGGNLTAFLGQGNNQVSVAGTVGASLIQRGGYGDDSLWLASDASVARTVTTYLGNGTNTVNLDGSVRESVTVRGGTQADDVTVGTGAQVGGSVVAWLGIGSGSVTVNGDVAGSLMLRTANYYNDQGALSIAGTVGRGVNAFLGSGPNNVHVSASATITGNLLLTGGLREDHVTLGGTVTQAVFALLGSGDNSLTLSGTIGSDFRYLGLDGDDALVVESSGKIGGSVQASLGGAQGASGKNTLWHQGRTDGNLLAFSSNSSDDVQIAPSSVGGFTYVSKGSSSSDGGESTGHYSRLG